MLRPAEFKEKCKGVVVVQYCPYTMDSSSIDFGALKNNTKFLVDFAKGGNKDVVIMTNGSTTENYANSIEEQKSVIKTVVETVDGAVPVVAGVSQPGTKKTIELAKYAQEVGADCVMVSLPYYHTPFKEGLYQHFKEIADSVEIAVMVYNNPDVTGAMIEPQLAAILSEIENIVAFKDNSNMNEDHFFKTLFIDPNDMTLLAGMGEISYVGAAVYGFRYKGFITFIGNFMPQVSYELYEAVAKERDFLKAQSILNRIAPLFNLVNKVSAKRKSYSIIPDAYKSPYAYMDLGKAAMDLVPGLYGGPVRSPMQNSTDDEKKELKKVLSELGVL